MPPTSESPSQGTTPSVAHATATGKVMLAYADGAAAAAPLEGYTDRTVTDARRLKKEIDEVRGSGWAQAVKEREPDLNAIAVYRQQGNNLIPVKTIVPSPDLIG